MNFPFYLIKISAGAIQENVSQDCTNKKIEKSKISFLNQKDSQIQNDKVVKLLLSLKKDERISC